MQIIPVIDLKKGHVVHAIEGHRDKYEPVQSKLCGNSNPLNIINSLLVLYPFNIFYIADIDAITGSGNNNNIIDEIHKTCPDKTLWLDNGISSHNQLSKNNTTGIINIIGTETNITKTELQLIKAMYPDAILSLDYSNNRFLGDESIVNAIDTWLNNIIVMSLDRVGTKSSPDFECISKIQALAPGKKIFAAGGIRNITDLKMLQDTGIKGALLATALHTQSITIENLLEINET